MTNTTLNYVFEDNGAQYRGSTGVAQGEVVTQEAVQALLGKLVGKAKPGQIEAINNNGGLYIYSAPIARARGEAVENQVVINSTHLGQGVHVTYDYLQQTGLPDVNDILLQHQTAKEVARATAQLTQPEPVFLR